MQEKHAVVALASKYSSTKSARGVRTVARRKEDRRQWGTPEDQIPMSRSHRGGIGDFSIQIVIR